jgi:hypothetical protein
MGRRSSAIEEGRELLHAVVTREAGGRRRPGADEWDPLSVGGKIPIRGSI